MSDQVCRRVGCPNTLIDADAEKGYEHCSSDCCEALEDLGDAAFADKQAHHDKAVTGRSRPDVARQALQEHEDRERVRKNYRKVRGNREGAKNPKSLRARRSAGKKRRDE